MCKHLNWLPLDLSKIHIENTTGIQWIFQAEFTMQGLGIFFNILLLLMPILQVAMTNQCLTMVEGKYKPMMFYMIIF